MLKDIPKNEVYAEPARIALLRRAGAEGKSTSLDLPVLPNALQILRGELFFVTPLKSSLIYRQLEKIKLRMVDYKAE
jgi:hypothetical protein